MADHRSLESRPPSEPTENQAGLFGEAGWGWRWLRTLEVAEFGSRLPRWQRYVQQSQVLSVAIVPGSVRARVQGARSRPYDVVIEVPLLSDIQWQAVIEAISQQARLSVKLLAGKIPHEIEQVFDQAKAPLFPRIDRDVKTACSCPVSTNPCKHVVSVYYLLAGEFDVDPFQMFVLRGRSKEQILEAIRIRRGVAAATIPDGSSADPGDPGAQPLTAALRTFWLSGDVDVHFNGPHVPLETLQRLGASPAHTDTALAAWYAAMTDFVLRKVLNDE